MELLLLALLALLVVGYSTGASIATAASQSSTDGLGVLSTNNLNTTGVALYNSDGSLTGNFITNDPNTWPGDDKVWNCCAAVAMAEGYNLGPGTAPYDLNNPGDLSPGDEDGQETNGPAQQHGGSAIIFFSTAEGGWMALRTKFLNILGNRSHVYPATFTWAQIAAKYAGNSTAWLANVTNYLGVDPNSTPAQYVGS